MVWVFVVVAALGVFAIAAAAVGGVTGRLAAAPPRAHFDIEEAVTWVADRLPEEVTARVSYDDVRATILWHLRYLRARGVASTRSEEEPEALVVVGDDEPLAWVLGRLGEEGREVADEDAAAILDAEASYLEAIGAIGGEVAPPPDPA